MCFYLCFYLSVSQSQFTPAPPHPHTLIRHAHSIIQSLDCITIHVHRPSENRQTAVCVTKQALQFSITRTSECFISLGRTYELCLCTVISQVQRMSEIALNKNNECVLQPRLIKHELFLVFIPYYP